MFSDFVRTLQRDIDTLSTYFQSNRPVNDDLQTRASYAALRILSIFGMSFSTALGIVGVVKASMAIDGILKIGIAIFLFALSHDAYILAGRSKHSIGSRVADLSRIIFNKYHSAFNQFKQISTHSPNPSTYGTYLRPIWDLAGNILFSQNNSQTTKIN